jgi:hypothetical protein
MIYISVNCETEDSSDQAGGSYIFETGPVLGRRAERERATETNSQSRVSESEVSDDSDWMKVRSLIIIFIKMTNLLISLLTHLFVTGSKKL